MKRSLSLIILFCVLSSLSGPKQLTWVAIGDSITYLNEHLDETGNRVTKGYMTRVKDVLPTTNYINQGHNGWTSGGIAEKIETLGIVKADVYSVFLGTNDWWQGRPLGNISNYRDNTGNSTVYGSYRIIINKLRLLNANAKIILITPMQRSDFVYITNYKNNAWGSYKEKNGQSLEQFAAAIAAIAKYENFTLINLYTEKRMDQKDLVKFKRLKDPKTGIYKNYPYTSFIDITFNPETDEYPYPAEAVNITYDGLHPSDKGYDLIAKALIRVMKGY
jgi:lysophospholipase L1-like esterase